MQQTNRDAVTFAGSDQDQYHPRDLDVGSFLAQNCISSMSHWHRRCQYAAVLRNQSSLEPSRRRRIFEGHDSKLQSRSRRNMCKMAWKASTWLQPCLLTVEHQTVFFQTDFFSTTLVWITWQVFPAPLLRSYVAMGDSVGYRVKMQHECKVCVGRRSVFPQCQPKAAH